MRFRWLPVLLVATSLLVAPTAATAQDGAPIDDEYLGQFTFIGDGVIEFVVVGDQIIGRTTTQPQSTGINLVGGAVPCPEYASDEVFVLDRTGVGQWFWYANPRFECVRLGGVPVTVEFGILGADATGEMPPAHPDFTTVPVGHSMLRLVPIFPQAPTTTTTTTTPAPTSPAPTTTEGELVIIGVNDERIAEEAFWRALDTWVAVTVVLGLLTLAAWGIYQREHWCPIARRRRASGLSTGEAPEQREEEQSECRCSVNVEIIGPTEFGTCCEQKLSLALHSCGREHGLEGVSRDPLQIHLDADVAGRSGWDFVDAIYEAKLTPTCEGGGRVLVDDADAAWSILSQTADGFVLEVRVLVPMECPDGAAHDKVFATAQLEVVYHRAPCLVAVIFKINAFDDVSHIDVHIQCGSYSEVFGYFPFGERTFASTIPGAPGKVIRVPGSDVVKDRDTGYTMQVRDGLGSEYRASTDHSHLDLDVYWLEADDCSACGEFRNEWEILHARPGTYWLTSNNCATQAWRTLVTAGLVPDRSLDVARRPGNVANLMAENHALGNHPPGVTSLPAQEIRR